MIYAAFLRGINVGGKNKVAMGRLKDLFEQLGFTDVKTYINSGNIIFRDEKLALTELAPRIEKTLVTEFGFPVRTLVRTIANIQAIQKALPPDWVNDQSMKCDVMLLWENLSKAEVLSRLVIKPGIDEVKYVGGAILWKVDKQHVTKSGMMKLVSTDLYKNMTIRNCNTLRKLAAMMEN